MMYYTLRNGHLNSGSVYMQKSKSLSSMESCEGLKTSVHGVIMLNNAIR